MNTPRPRKSGQPKDDPNNPERMFHHFHRVSHDPNKSPSERLRAALDCVDLIRHIGYWPD
jgi:hypothetical protein